MTKYAMKERKIRIHGLVAELRKTELMPNERPAGRIICILKKDELKILKFIKKLHTECGLQNLNDLNK